MSQLKEKFDLLKSRIFKKENMADEYKNKIIFALPIGLILLLIGSELLNIIAFLILFYGVFYPVIVLLMNKEFLGNKIQSVHCPHCNNQLKLRDIPIKKGIFFPCPSCGKNIKN